MIENATLRAAEIVEEAQKKAQALIAAAKAEIEEKNKVFQASLQLACRQGIEMLKQKIEGQLFDVQLSEMIVKELTDPKLIAHLIEAFLKIMEEKGIEEEFVAIIPKTIQPRAINALLGSKILEKLQKETVVVGDFAGGVKIQLKGRQITIDISDATIKEILAQYIRRDFREMVFGN
jgi:V/A-type H+-transporting ATPase subunit E